MDKYTAHMINTKENSRKIGEIIEQIKPKNPSHSDKIDSLSVIHHPCYQSTGMSCTWKKSKLRMSCTWKKSSLRGVHRVLYSLTLYSPRE